MDVTALKRFYAGKKIFVTGNTGFKGTWLSNLLTVLGADICGYADRKSRIYEQSQMENKIKTVYGDVRDYEKLDRSLAEFKPDMVLHMAAQPLVLDGYRDPKNTFDINIMGTVNLFTALMHCDNLGSVVNVTTDKVYLNLETGRAYREEDTLGGKDPYSASKSCSEMITASFRNSFKNNFGVATARAGNVIGGGDFSADRIIPDCVRAAKQQREIILRNPGSVRPWQHVLEPLTGYLLLLQKLYDKSTKASAFNFGPDREDCISVGELTSLFCEAWGDGLQWKKEGPDRAGQGRESGLLLLDAGKAKRVLEWKPVWSVKEAVLKTVEWYKEAVAPEDVLKLICRQTQEYL